MIEIVIYFVVTDVDRYQFIYIFLYESAHDEPMIIFIHIDWLEERVIVIILLFV